MGDSSESRESQEGRLYTEDQVLMLLHQMRNYPVRSWAEFWWDVYFNIFAILITFLCFYHNYQIYTGESNYLTVSETALVWAKEYPILLVGLGILIGKPRRFNEWLRRRPYWGVWFGIVIGHTFWPLFPYLR